MEKLITLFQEFLLKAIEQTEAAMTYFDDGGKLEAFTANRDRLFQVIDQISRQIDWAQASDQTRAELAQQIEYIKKLDEQLLTKLQEHREGLKAELEQTHRNGESLKGYNLNNVK